MRAGRKDGCRGTARRARSGSKENSTLFCLPPCVKMKNEITAHGGKILRLLLTVLAVVGLDQLSKYLVMNTMEVGQSISIIPNFFYITYIRNPGAAFGMLPYRTTFFILVTIIVLVFILYYYRTLPAGFGLLRFGLALQLGGALGNLIDRLRHNGDVVDFLSFNIFPPVFNIADSAIVVGVGIFLIAFWRLSPRLERSR